MRTLMFFAAAAIAAAGLLLRAPVTPRTAYACIAPPGTPEEGIRGATLIAVVEITSAGDDVIREPTLPPLVTTSDTATSPATATKIPRLILRTPTPTATPTPRIHPELAGTGATAYIVEHIAGMQTTGPMEIDREGRRSYEQHLRRLEAGYPRPLCGMNIPMRYEAGTRYLLVASTSGEHLYTARAFRVEGDRALVGGRLAIWASTYRQYLAGIPMEPWEYGDGTRAAVMVTGHVPLARLIPMLKAIHAGIAPPDTGSAGLAAGRR